MLNNMKIRWRLAIGFSAVIVLTALMGVIALDSIRDIAGLTDRLYRHPFTVSNGILEAQADVNDMRRLLKDVLLTNDPAEIDDLNSKIDARELETFRHLDIVRERYLGNKNELDETMRLLVIWRAVRDQVIALAREGRRGEAEALAKSEARKRMGDVLSHMEGIITFARNKALEFMNNAADERERAIRSMMIILGITTVAAAAVGFVITRSVTTPLTRITDALTEIARGRTDVLIGGSEHRDEIGAMATAATIFKEAAERTRDRNWVKTNVTDIIADLQRADTFGEFGNALLGALMPLLEGGHGVLHLFDEESQRLTLVSSWGFNRRKRLANTFGLGDGLLGQCALEHKPITLTGIPDDYVVIGSGLGEARPRIILAHPLMVQNTLLGVVEIATFSAMTELRQNLLDDLLPMVAVILDNLRRGIETRDLLEKTQAQAQALEASEEEIKAQSEELSASNEELRAKTEALERQTTELEASERELRNQREELQASNEELREKTEALESQKTQLERTQTEVERKARELSRASQYKSEFLANMSHELRTPLNSLLILSKGLAENEEGNLTEDQVESVNIIHDSGTDLLSLINDILDLSKIEAGKMEVAFDDVSLMALAEELERRFDHMAENRKLALEIAVADGLPGSIRTDPARLGQILNNLVSNALKFTDHGKVSVRIERPRAAHAGMVDGIDTVRGIAVAIADTGIGIPEHELERIFHAFEQVDGRTSRRHGGTGLGLSISLQLAKLLGGTIVVESAVGTGSTFTLLLPETPRGAAAAVPPPPPPAVSRKQPKASRETPPEAHPCIPDDRDGIGPGDRTILVIEDDLAFAKILYGLAHKKGFKCLAAADGESGLDLARTGQPTGIILDVGLPNMDGWTVMGRLKDDPATRHIPVHFISAADDSGRGMERGAVGFLTKPVTREQIDGAFERIQHFALGTIRRLLIVEDDPASQKAITNLVASEGVEIVVVASGEEAIETLTAQAFDCVILDLGLPGMDGYEFLERASSDAGFTLPPVVIYSGKDLSSEDNMRLREYTDSIVIKGARSPERLVDEVTLFLHSVHGNLPPEQQRMLQAAYERDDGLVGKKVLVVDDDMRNTFALAKVLRNKGFDVLMAKDGDKALRQLDENSGIDIVLMDIMMPGKDGYETIGDIRKQDRFRSLPILAVTAKAMLGDREKCLEAGANDYLSKPIDLDKLLSMMRVWL